MRRRCTLVAAAGAVVLAVLASGKEDGWCAADDYMCLAHGNQIYAEELRQRKNEGLNKAEGQPPRPPAPPRARVRAPPNTPTAVTLHNEGQIDLDVYWKNPSSEGENAMMGSVAVGSTMAMNSFSDHKFLVYPAGGWTVLKELTIFADRADYWLEFELEDADDGSASSVSHSAALSSPGERTGELELREKRQNDGLLRSFGTSVAVKFRNLSGRQVQLWYDDGRSGVRSSVIRPGRDATTNSYPGHVFCFTEMWLTELPGGGGCGISSGLPDGVLGKATINTDDYTYLFDDGTASDEEKGRWQVELDFDRGYMNRTGRHWVSFYPRDPPKLHMWDADFVGQVHTITTRHTQFHCVPSERDLATSSVSDECREGGTEPEKFPQDLDALVLDDASGKWGGGSDIAALYPTMDLTLEVLSIYPGPKVFLIKNLISEAEADHITTVGAPKVSRSMTGQADSAYESDTRTSKTGWVPRTTSPIMEAIFRRVADLLKIDEGLLQAGQNAELLQVVHYDPEQKYDAHHGK
jgi:hypothetical protein